VLQNSPPLHIHRIQIHSTAPSHSPRLLRLCRHRRRWSPPPSEMTKPQSYHCVQDPQTGKFAPMSATAPSSRALRRRPRRGLSRRRPWQGIWRRRPRRRQRWCRSGGFEEEGHTFFIDAQDDGRALFISAQDEGTSSSSAAKKKPSARSPWRTPRRSPHRGATMWC
jgi:hypothetical protein